MKLYRLALLIVVAAPMFALNSCTSKPCCYACWYESLGDQTIQRCYPSGCDSNNLCG